MWRADLWLAAGMALRFQLLLVASTALVFRSGVGFRGLGEARAGGAPPCPVVRCWGLFPVARGSWAGCVRARVPVVCGPSPKYMRSERIRGYLPGVVRRFSRLFLLLVPAICLVARVSLC